MVKKAFLLILIVVSITSCSAKKQNFVTPVCRHNSIYAALAWSDLTGEKTMIAYGPTMSDKNIWHAQAIVMDGTSVKGYLSVINGKIFLTRQDRFAMLYVDSIDEFIVKLRKTNNSLTSIDF